MREVLTLLTWPDYISPATVRQFGKETGIDIELEIVPSAVELVERMRQPGLPTRLRGARVKCRWPLI